MDPVSLPFDGPHPSSTGQGNQENLAKENFIPGEEEETGIRTPMSHLHPS